MRSVRANLLHTPGRTAQAHAAFLRTTLTTGNAPERAMSLQGARIQTGAIS
jgi:predicted RNA polymerase sigma factor